MPETTAASIKGRLHELGSRLELAPGYVYVGRCCKRGGWDLEQSPFRNPFSVTKYGFGGAIERYRFHLASRPDLIEQARAKLTGMVLCCFCTDLARCHTRLLVQVSEGRARWLDPNPPALKLKPSGDCGDYFGRVVTPSNQETVRPVGIWAGAL